MRCLLLLSLCSFVSLAHAQPAPEPPTPTPTPAPEPEMPVPPPVEPAPPPAAPIVTAPPAAPAPTIAPTAEAPEQPGKRLGIGSVGFLQFGGLLQAWLIHERAEGRTNLSAFRIRRAEVVLKGEILPKRVAFNVMFDVARVREATDGTIVDSSGDTAPVRIPGTPSSPLQDMAITFLSSSADVTVGQFKIPVSWEGLNASARTVLPERAPGSNLFGDRRDIGLKIAKTFPRWSYHAGVYNGTGSNVLDNNVQKDVALRLEAYPIKGLTIAGVAYDSVGIRHRRGTKDRWEADLRYEANNLLVQAEFIEAREVRADNADPIKGRTAYLALGYTLAVPALRAELQPVARVGYLDTNTELDLDPTMGNEDELIHIDVGLNYFLKSHEMKLQAAFQRQHFDDRAANNQLIVTAQVFYQ